MFFFSFYCIYLGNKIKGGNGLIWGFSGYYPFNSHEPFDL